MPTPPDDALYAYHGLKFYRVETISGSATGDIVGVLIDGVMDFWHADFHSDEDGDYYVLTHRTE